jgi:hypothetical protein
MAAGAPTTINGTRALAAAALRVSPAGRHGPNGEAVCGGQAEWLALAACAAIAGEKMPSLRDLH